MYEATYNISSCPSAEKETDNRQLPKIDAYHFIVTEECDISTEFNWYPSPFL